jgi:RND family efflux transporter MFP subunit
MRIHPLIPCLFGLVALSACNDQSASTADTRQKIALPTMIVQATEVPDIYRVPGSVISDDRVELSSRVVGFIKRLDVREGQVVKSGEVLVEIDPRDIDEAVRQAQAVVVGARNDLDDAEYDVNKYTGLAEKGATTNEVLRKSVVRRDIARTALARAEAALATAEAQKTYASIPSPVDGVVLIRHKQSGDLATAGAPLLTIEARRNLLFKTFVAEAQLSRITPLMPASVYVDAVAGRVIEGTVQRIVPSGDPVTRRFEVAIAIPADPALLPGMFGRVEFRFGTAPAMTIPAQAKVQRGGLDGVYVVGGDNVARFRWLRFGRQWNGLAEVTAGLSPGETIVSQATQAILEGIMIASSCAGETCGKHHE